MKYIQRKLSCPECLKKKLPRKNSLSLVVQKGKLTTSKANSPLIGVTPHIIVIERFVAGEMYWRYICGVCFLHGQSWSRGRGDTEKWNEGKIREH